MRILNSFPFLMSIIIFCCLWRPSELRNDTDCIHRCGNIEIPYPFGSGPKHCFLDPNFAVSCNSSSPLQSVPFLKKLNLEIYNVGVDAVLDPMRSWGTVTVKIPSVAACSSNRSTGTKVMWTSHNLTNSSFRFSYSLNVFASVGCDGYALFYNETGGITAGCTSVCSWKPPAVVGSSSSKCYSYQCCARTASIYGSIGEIKQYGVSVSTNNTSGNCRSAFLISKQYLEDKAPFSPRMTTVPVVLKWDSLDVDHQTFWSYILFGFIYLLMPTIIALMIYGCYWQYWRLKTKKTRKEIKLRAKYFKEKLQVEGSASIAAEKTKLFTLTELKRLTNNFSKDRVLGEGGQGTVYKGMLNDGQVIAVKRSRALDDSESWQQFINEVILLSEIKHRNVVKVLGCCLEDDIPLVVYEFICNGTLSEHIQKSIDKFIFTWELRLKIAFEVATAISYLHSEVSIRIYHRDIKSSNILLDDKFRAKLSDFGISRAVSVEQTHLTTHVQGTFGYLDPEYFYSCQYSEKSDVYSFGVILVELLTGQKPIRSQKVVHEEENEDKEERSLAMYFYSSMNYGTLFDIIDPMVLEGSKKEDIIEFANLAKQCLNPTGLERPTMKEVIMVLDGIRCQNSSCLSLLKSNEQAGHWATRSSSMITSSMETSSVYLRPVTYNHIDLTTDSDPANVEMRLLHTA